MSEEEERARCQVVVENISNFDAQDEEYWCAVDEVAAARAEAFEAGKCSAAADFDRIRAHADRDLIDAQAKLARVEALANSLASRLDVAKAERAATSDEEDTFIDGWNDAEIYVSCELRAALADSGEKS